PRPEEVRPTHHRVFRTAVYRGPAPFYERHQSVCFCGERLKDLLHLSTPFRRSAHGIVGARESAVLSDSPKMHAKQGYQRDGKNEDVKDIEANQRIFAHKVRAEQQAPLESARV